MLINGETLQRLIDRQVELDRQHDLIMSARRVGDEEMARFYELKPEQQQTLLARQDIGDAVEAARQGNAAGVQRGIQSAVERHIYGGAALANPRQQRPLPRRKRGR